MNRVSLRNPLFFCTLIFLAYVVGLWGMSVPLTGDQKTYLSIALEMFEKKEWMIPTLFGESNFLKPPFQYWATIAGWKWLGFGLFGALLPSVLALVGSSFLAHEVGKKIGLVSPALAAVLFAATLGSMTYGTTAQMEIWVVFFFLAAWLAALREKIIWAFFWVGIMAWVKGPLYPVLWTLCFSVWSPSSLRTKKFWGALVFGIVVGLGWYVAAARTHFDEMWKQFFHTENLGKMSTNQGSPFVLWGEFLYSLFPWGFLLLPGCFQNETRERWKQNRKFYLAYALVPAIFFTLFPYRVNTYLYFLTPVFAMLASEVEIALTPRLKKWVWSFYGVVFLFSLALVCRLVEGAWIGADIGGGIAISIFIFMIGLVKAEWKYVMLASLLLVNLIRVAAVEIGTRDLADLKKVSASREDSFAYFLDSRDIWHEYGLISSAIGRRMERIFDKATLDSFLAQGGSVIFQEEQTPELRSSLQCVEWQRLKRRAKFPIQRFFTQGIQWGDPEVTRILHICTRGQ